MNELTQLEEAVTTKKCNGFNKIYLKFYDTVTNKHCVAIRKDYYLNKDQHRNTCRVYDDSSKIYNRLYKEISTYSI